MVDLGSCERKYEKCRVRSSILHVASAFFFLIAIISLIYIFPEAKFNIILGVTDASAQTKSVMHDFYWLVYIPFMLIFIFHLIRLYLSLLVIDEDPDFYYHNLRLLKKKQRVIEYVLRISVFLILIWFAKHQLNSGLAKDHVSSLQGVTGSLFVPLVVMYVVLLTWDLLMAIYVGVKGLSKTYNSRVSYFVNDITGLIMSVIFLTLGAGVFTIESIIKLNLLIYILLSIALISLVVDIIKNKKYRQHMRELFNYFNFPCTDLSLAALSCPCDNDSDHDDN